MFRVKRRQISLKLSLQQHAGQSPIHTQVGSIKINLWSIGTVRGPHRIMECCPVRVSGSQIAHYLSPRHVSAHCTLCYPDLPCPAVFLYLCVCVSLLCVSDLTYLSPFVSLSLCYCSGDYRPSIVQPVMAILRPVRSSCSRERTSP
jgi:hypothetical protein